MSDCIETDEIKCCGSGCNNCVLDEKKISRLDSSKSAKANLLTIDGSKYVNFTLQKKWKYTENVWRFEFTYKDDVDLQSMELTIPPGCHVMIRAIIDEINLNRHDQTTVENFISRPYTPIHVDVKAAKFEILVKFEPNGLMSKYWRNISIDDVVGVKGPYGTFKWIPNSVRNLICLSQGVAIAPMFAIVQNILNNEDDETWIDFLSCFRCIDDILLRDEIYDFRQYWNFQSTIYLSNEAACSCDANVRSRYCVCIKSKLKYNEIICTFRLDEVELSNLFIKKRIENCLILVCGTSRFINSIKMSLKKLHIKDENIVVFD